jgi:hypothetical protein
MKRSKLFLWGTFIIGAAFSLVPAGCPMESGEEATKPVSTESGEGTTEPISVGDFRIEISGGEVTITGYTGSAYEVTIPGQIGGLPVTAIGEKAFFENQLTGVTFPDSVRLLPKITTTHNL